MSSDTTQIEVRNRQRKWPLNIEFVEEIATWVARSLFKDVESDISIQFLASRRMTEINQEYLQHEGPTDVITFDLSDEPTLLMMGEILICPEIAAKQSKEFDTNWHEETIRYVIHGLLHLKGFDDLEPEKRKVMKRHENRWMERVQEKYNLSRVPS